MKQLKNIQSKWNWAKRLIFGGWIFWLFETAYFIAVYGWHWQPINETEKLCDNIAGIVMLTGLGLAFMAIAVIVDAVLEAEEIEE